MTRPAAGRRGRSPDARRTEPRLYTPGRDDNRRWRGRCTPCTPLPPEIGAVCTSVAGAVAAFVRAAIRRTSPAMPWQLHVVRATAGEGRRRGHVQAANSVAAVVRAAPDARRLRWRGGCTPCAPLPPRANGARTFALPCRSKLVTPVALAKRVAEPSDAGAAAVCAAAAEDRSRAVAALVIGDRDEQHVHGGHDGTGMWHVSSGHDGADV